MEGRLLEFVRGVKIGTHLQQQTYDRSEPIARCPMQSRLLAVGCIDIRPGGNRGSYSREITGFCGLKELLVNFLWCHAILRDCLSLPLVISVAALGDSVGMPRLLA